MLLLLVYPALEVGLSGRENNSAAIPFFMHEASISSNRASSSSLTSHLNLSLFDVCHAFLLLTSSELLISLRLSKVEFNAFMKSEVMRSNTIDGFGAT